jgi:hypothetical protein
MLGNRYEGITRPCNDYEARKYHYEYLCRNEARYEARNAAVWPLLKTPFALWCLPSRHTHRREKTSDRKLLDSAVGVVK